MVSIMLSTTMTTLNTKAIDSSGGHAPEWVELIPAGEVIGRDGRRWVNNGPSAVLRAFQRNGADLPVDLEHATELKATKGEPAPAVGWVKELDIRDGTIWGRVDWNRTGSQLIVTRQYRYLSPVIVYEKSSGLIVGLTSVGLTNRPNLHLGALNTQGAVGVRPSAVLSADEQKICWLMGVPEDTYLHAKKMEVNNYGR